jgi:hypothetical protein
MVAITQGLLFGRGFGGPYVAAPAVPAGAETYAYTVYGRPFQLDSLASVDDMTEALFGLYLSFAALPADGAFILAGVGELADEVAPTPPAVRALPDWLLLNDGPITITAAGPTSTFSIPGPAAGFVRLFGLTTMVCALPAPNATTVTAQIQPEGLWLSRGLAIGTTPVALTGSASGLYVLGFGDSIDIVNVGGAGVSAQLEVLYLDVPSDDVTTFRTLLNGVTPVTIIPAPAVGFVNHWLLANKPSAFGALQMSEVAAGILINDDTAAAQVVVKYNGILSRAASLTAGNNASPPGTLFPLRHAVTMETAIAPTARNPFVIGAYVTLPE